MSFGYAAWIIVGVLAAMAASRWQRQVELRRPRREPQLEPAVRQAIWFAALAGAVLGAYGLELPADLCGWHAPAPAGGDAGHALPMGGRTVLGGLLGGWVGVEGMKKVAGVRQSTGADFALPLAVALGCGRLGCLAAGCCAGVECEAAWWASVDAAGVPRVPTQLLEAGFHFAAAIVLAVAVQRDWPASRRLPAYFASYAVARFLVEFGRQHPVVAVGLSYHQALAAVLFAWAAVTWWRRRGPPHGSTYRPPTSAP